MSAFAKFHTMIAIRGGRLRCIRCRYESDLPGAARHAVEQQVDMTLWVEKPLGAG